MLKRITYHYKININILLRITVWFTRYFDSHATAVECDTSLYNWCSRLYTEYSWWLTRISDIRSTRKNFLIHMALFSTRKFSYRVCVSKNLY